jgi:DNA modification methylase
VNEIDLRQGDALELLKSIPDESIDLIVTDPPYRCISGGRAGKKNQPSGILKKNDGKLFKHNDIKPEAWFPELYRVLKPGSHCYVMVNTVNLLNFMTVAKKSKFLLHNLLVWHKNNAVTNRWYMKNAEYILFLRKGRAKPIKHAGSKTVHEFYNTRNKSHPAEKPVDLMEFYIKNSSNRGDLVLDPFMGSGATGVACVNTGRRFIGMELDEQYFGIALERIEELFTV